LKLIICEKKSQAESIANSLNVPSANKLNFISNSFIVTFLQGHVMSLKNADEYDKTYSKWKFEDLPILPKPFQIKENKETAFLIENIDSLISNNSIQSIVCATDAGREGELIFRYVYNHLKISLPIERLWISSLTSEAIQTGFQNLRPGKDYDNLFRAAFARACADWLVGINFTRLYSILSKSLVRVGRVTTPTLWMIVERDKLIDSHKKHFNYSISCKALSLDFKLSSEDISIFKTKFQAESYFSKVKDLNKAIFLEPILERKKMNPPKLFSLDTLQQEANKLFGFTAKKTLELAQLLYDKHKLISYPRTSSEFLSLDMINEAREIGAFHKLNESMSSDFFENNTKRYFNDHKVTDHHAIIPTKQTASSLNKDEGSLYNIILKRFSAIFMDFAIICEHTIKLDAAGNLFVSKFRTLEKAGYLKYLSEDSISNYHDTSVLNNLPKMNDTVSIDKPSFDEIEAKAPNRFTDSSLLSSMKNAGKFVDETLRKNLKDIGIGTQATRADIIENLVRSAYVERKGKSLVSTKVGKKIISFLPTAFSQPTLTADWESKLELIEQGNYSAKEFLDEVKTQVSKIISTDFNFEDFEIIKEQAKLCSCPSCDGDVVDKKSFYGCSNYKSGCKFTLSKTIASKKLTSLQARKLIEDKETSKIKGFKSKKGTFDTKLFLELAEDGKSKISFFKNT
jgi:DNA topoisomerase-3